jgi:hypothetical protein
MTEDHQRLVLQVQAQRPLKAVPRQSFTRISHKCPIQGKEYGVVSTLMQITLRKNTALVDNVHCKQ